MRFTPGDWRIERVKPKGKRHHVLFIVGDVDNLDGSPVACVGDPTMPFVEANADLFAASKDLLAALERARPWVDDAADLRAVDAAIAKAKGETP